MKKNWLTYLPFIAFGVFVVSGAYLVGRGDFREQRTEGIVELPGPTAAPVATEIPTESPSPTFEPTFEPQPSLDPLPTPFTTKPSVIRSGHGEDDD